MAFVLAPLLLVLLCPFPPLVRAAEHEHGDDYYMVVAVSSLKPKASSYCLGHRGMLVRASGNACIHALRTAVLLCSICSSNLLLYACMNACVRVCVCFYKDLRLCCVTFDDMT